MQCTQQTQRTTWPNGYAHVSDNPPPCPSGMATISARRLIYASSQTVNTSFIYGHSRVTRRCTGLASASVLTACLAVLLPRCGHLNGSVFNILRIRHAAHTHTHTPLAKYIDTRAYMYVYIWYIAICMACVFNATAVEANGKSDTKRLQQRQRQSMKWGWAWQTAMQMHNTHVTHTQRARDRHTTLRLT